MFISLDLNCFIEWFGWGLFVWTFFQGEGCGGFALLLFLSGAV